MLGKLDNHMEKNAAEPWPYTTHKNQFQMDSRVKHEVDETGAYYTEWSKPEGKT